MREGRLGVGEANIARRANRGDGGGRATDIVRTCGEGIGACKEKRGCEMENEPGNERAEESTSKDTDIREWVTLNVSSQFRNEPLKRIVVNFLSNRALALEISSNAGRMQSANSGHTNQCRPAQR